MHFLPPVLLRRGVQYDAETARLQDRWGVSAVIYHVVTGDSVYQAGGLENVGEIRAVGGRAALEHALGDPAWLEWTRGWPGPAGVVEGVLWEGI